jgi:hypothetical protein
MLLAVLLVLVLVLALVLNGVGWQLRVSGWRMCVGSAACALYTRSQTLICLCLYPLGLGCSSARASGYGSVNDHRPDVKLGF